MSKKQYHHGDLKKTLIKNGLRLLNDKGYGGLSLRKVALMCGVSHSAPYKHFRNKDDLIAAITLEVTHEFTASLQSTSLQYSTHPGRQILMMGIEYVRFMVENPDYLKFIFLNRQSPPIRIENGEFICEEICPFHIFQESANHYLEYIQSKPETRVTDILSMWSIVHGIAVLISTNSIMYKGDYLEMVSNMLQSKLHILLD